MKQRQDSFLSSLNLALKRFFGVGVKILFIADFLRRGNGSNKNLPNHFRPRRFFYKTTMCSPDLSNRWPYATPFVELNQSSLKRATPHMSPPPLHWPVVPFQASVKLVERPPSSLPFCFFLHPLQLHLEFTRYECR